MSLTPLSLAKESLQIAHDKQDAYIQALLDGAENFLAAQLNVGFGAADCVEDLPDGGDSSVPLLYNAWNRPAGETFLLPRHRPVNALTSVVDLWTGTAENAQLSGAGLLQRIDSTGRPLGSWPWGEKRYRVSFNAGYASLPAALTQAVLMLVSRAYAARGGEIQSAAAGEKIVFGLYTRSDIVELIRPFSQRWRAVC